MYFLLKYVLPPVLFTLTQVVLLLITSTFTRVQIQSNLGTTACSYVYFILHVLSVVVSLIGGVPRMGPRVLFALLPFGHYPIKYLKQSVVSRAGSHGALYRDLNNSRKPNSITVLIYNPFSLTVSTNTEQKNNVSLNAQ